MCHLNNHLDRGQGGGQVLSVRGSDSDWDTARVQASVEGGDQVDSCTQMFPFYSLLVVEMIQP